MGLQHLSAPLLLPWWALLLMMCLFYPIGPFYKAAVQRKNKKFVYYGVVIQLIQTFTTSGIVLGSFVTVTWKNCFIEVDSIITASLVCCSESLPTIELVLYVSGVFLHIITIVLLIICLKSAYFGLKEVKEIDIA